MKRTIASTVPVLALLIATNHASAQPLSDRVSPEVAKEQYLKAEQRAAHFLQEILKASQDGPQVPRQELRQKVRPLVEEAFEARQRLQRAELDVLRRRLEDIEQAIENRGRNKEAIINDKIEEVLNRTPVKKDAQSRLSGDPNLMKKGRDPRSDVADFTRPMVPERNDPAEFDLETRQRLAEIDLQAAEEDYRAAGDEMAQAGKLRETAVISEAEFRVREKGYRQAALEVKRAHVKLEGVRRQQTELQAKADDAIDAATAEEREAMARLHGCEANVETAQARVAAAEADVAKAKAAYEYQENQHQRVMRLFEKNAVEEKVFDEATEQLRTKKADLDGANAALAVAMANLNQSKKVIEESVAQVKSAEARVRATKIERGRLGRRGQGEAVPTTQDNAPVRRSEE